MVKNVRLRSERGGDVIQVYTEDKASPFTPICQVFASTKESWSYRSRR
jgi:hypothetical protein